MASQRLSFMLNRRGDTSKNTASIYAQLQGPAQRAASQSTMNEAVAKGVPVEVTDPATGATLLSYSKAPSYDSAKRSADIASYRATIDPSQLAK